MVSRQKKLIYIYSKDLRWCIAVQREAFNLIYCHFHIHAAPNLLVLQVSHKLPHACIHTSIHSYCTYVQSYVHKQTSIIDAVFLHIHTGIYIILVLINASYMYIVVSDLLLVVP